MSNLPDGVRLTDIPGWDVEHVTTELECDASRLYVTAAAVDQARGALRHAVRVASAAGRPLTGAGLVEVLDTALRGHYRRADEIGEDEVCGFSGLAEGERERGVAYVTCPICDHKHELQED